MSVLTMGDRMPGLQALLDPAAEQDEPAARIVVVSNSCPQPAARSARRCRRDQLPENVGVSGGRNVAWQRPREFATST
ncbi:MULTISPECIES: glycosyltransferase family 2 protein [unclassified Streptomyces]|uniref:glycosyltransferase family 2 protein n=1 Tax=unclassified Streptomyces TaxID=2593676 RepID=UPI0004BD34DD|nr:MULTISPECIES: hypothetical protein [unclassified Streptomyces]